MEHKTKRQSLTLAKKLEIVRKLENGSTNSELCEVYKLSKSTISTIWANKQKIYKAANQQNVVKQK